MVVGTPPLVTTTKEVSTPYISWSAGGISPDTSVLATSDNEENNRICERSGDTGIGLQILAQEGPERGETGVGHWTLEMDVENLAPDGEK